MKYLELLFWDNLAEDAVLWCPSAIYNELIFLKDSEMFNNISLSDTTHNLWSTLFDVVNSYSALLLVHLSIRLLTILLVLYERSTGSALNPVEDRYFVKSSSLLTRVFSCFLIIPFL